MLDGNNNSKALMYRQKYPNFIYHSFEKTQAPDIVFFLPFVKFPEQNKRRGKQRRRNKCMPEDTDKDQLAESSYLFLPGVQDGLDITEIDAPKDPQQFLTAQN